MHHAQPVLHLFFVFFKQTMQFLQQINVKKSILYLVQQFQLMSILS